MKSILIKDTQRIVKPEKEDHLKSKEIGGIQTQARECL